MICTDCGRESRTLYVRGLAEHVCQPCIESALVLAGHAMPEVEVTYICPKCGRAVRPSESQNNTYHYFCLEGWMEKRLGH